MEGGGQKGDKEKAAVRRQEMFRLRCAGASFEQIGRQYGITAPAAFKHIKRVLDDIHAANTSENRDYVAVECERIDIAARAIARQVQCGDYQAIDRWIKLMERRAKLLGLDAPAKQEFSGPNGGPISVSVEAEKAIDKIYGSDTDTDI